MALFGFLKKERKGALPPPPPPLMDELPPLPSLELEQPPAPTMPMPPAPEEINEPFTLPELPSIEEPRLPSEERLQTAQREEIEIPVVTAEEALPEPQEVEERYHEPLVVQDRTMQARTFRGQPNVEERTFTQEVKRLAEPRLPIKKQEGTVFISVADYQDIMEHMTKTQQNIEESEQLLARLGELTNTEESLLDEWRGHLEDMEKKLSYVDQVIFEGE